MWSAANNARYLADSSDPLLMKHHCLVGLVFAAFSVEAMLNHFGDKLFDVWDELEVLSPVSKIKVIFDRLKMSYEPGKDPIQITEKLFKFRNSVAHGKTQTTSGKTLVSADVDHDKIVTNIEEYCPTKWDDFYTVRNLKRALDAAQEICNSIESAAGLESAPFHLTGVTQFSIHERDT